jgi:hypothetical protein
MTTRLPIAMFKGAALTTGILSLMLVGRGKWRNLKNHETAA